MLPQKALVRKHPLLSFCPLHPHFVFELFTPSAETDIFNSKGKQSCCNEATITAIDTATTGMENALNAAEDQWKNADLSNLKTQLNVLCGLNDDCKKQLTADINEVKSKIDAIVAATVDWWVH